MLILLLNNISMRNLIHSIRKRVDAALHGLNSQSKLSQNIRALKLQSRLGGDVVMGNKIEIGSIGSINANVVNFGTMREAAKESLYQVDHRHLVAPVRDDLVKFLDMLEESQFLDY